MPDQIDTAIIADMDQRGCAFDDGLRNAEHRTVGW